MPARAVAHDPQQRAHFDRLLSTTLDGMGLDYERVEEGAFLVTLTGEHKLTTMTWLVVQDHSLLVEAFFMRRPAENEGGTYGFLLGRNARTYAVHFSVDRNGDIWLTGHLSLKALDADEVDRILGCVRTYADENFDRAIALGFRSAIEREKAWRARQPADSPEARAPHLDRFR